MERLVEADILFIEGDRPRANYRFKHALIQDAAYESLLKSRRRTLHRRAAELLRDSPERAAAEPEAIARHFTDAGLDDLAIEWWGKAGDQALRRSAFQEAIAHLGKAIAMAEKTEATARQAAGGSTSGNQRLTQFHVAYGNALIAARGYAAPETTEAFARARESASDDKDATEQLAGAYGLWVGGYVRGELPSMRAHAQTFLDDVEARPNSPEAAVAHRIAGITCWFAGGYREARDHFAKALAVFQPGRDDDLAFRFGFDPGVGRDGLSCVCVVAARGGRSRDFAHRAHAEADRGDHPCRHARVCKIAHGLVRIDARRPRAASSRTPSELARLARQHKLTFHGAAAAFLEGWVKAQSGAPGGLEEMRRAIAEVRQQNVLTFLDLGSIALAEAEARAGDPDRAGALLDEALATDKRACCRAFEAELHRARGKILLRRDPANPAPSEDAFLAAIAVAKQQGARSFELRAALSLAKLYTATDRPAGAHAVLAPALEGFSLTSKFPEIEEALEILAAVEPSARS